MEWFLGRHIQHFVIRGRVLLGKGGICERKDLQMTEYKNTKGFTIWAALGSYAGFGIHKDRIVLGWMSICFVLYDIENMLYNLSLDAQRWHDAKRTNSE